MAADCPGAEAPEGEASSKVRFDEDLPPQARLETPADQDSLVDQGGSFRQPRMRVGSLTTIERRGAKDRLAVRITKEEALWGVIVTMGIAAMRDRILEDRDVEWYVLHFFCFWTPVAASVNYSNRFNDTDVFHKILWALFTMGMVMQVAYVFHDLGGFAVAASFLFLLIAVAYARTAWYLPRTRLLCACFGGQCLVAAGIFLALASTSYEMTGGRSPAWERRALWVNAVLESLVTLVFCLLTPGGQDTRCFNRRHWDIPLNIEYMVARFSGFHMMITVCSFLFPIGLQGAKFAASDMSALGVLFGNLYAVLLKVSIFDMSSFNNRQDYKFHAIRQSRLTCVLFVLSFPLGMLGIALTGVGFVAAISHATVPLHFSRLLLCIGPALTIAKFAFAKILHLPEDSFGHWLKTGLMAACAAAFFVPALFEFDLVPTMIFPNVCLASLVLSWLATDRIVGGSFPSNWTWKKPRLYLDHLQMDAIRVRCAPEEHSGTNGVYSRDGYYQGKPKFQNPAGAIIFFDQHWKLHVSDDTTKMTYTNESVAIDPPVGPWLRLGDHSQAIMVEKPEVIVVEATDEFQECSGAYQCCGDCDLKPMYRNANNKATLRYNAEAQKWEIRVDLLEEGEGDLPCYAVASTDREPPAGGWKSCGSGPPCTVSSPQANISTQEAFFTVLVAVCVFKLNEDFREDHDVQGWFLRFTIFYLMLNASMRYSARFAADDLSHKLLWSLFEFGLLLMLVGLGADAGGTARGATYKIAAAGTMMLLSIGFSLRSAIGIPRARGYCLIFAATHAVVASLIFVTVFFDTRLAVVLWLAALISLGADGIYVTLLQLLAVKPGSIYDVPMNIRYIIHRFDELQMEVLGVAIIVPSAIYPGDQAYPSLVVAAVALAALLSVFLKVALFDVEPTDISRHAVRRSKPHAVTFMYLNFSTLFSLVGIGAGTPLLIESSGADGMDGRSEFAQSVVCVATCCLFVSLSATKMVHRPMSSFKWHVGKAVVFVGGGLLALVPLVCRMSDFEVLAFTVAVFLLVVSPQIINPTRYVRKSPHGITQRRLTMDAAEVSDRDVEDSGVGALGTSLQDMLADEAPLTSSNQASEKTLKRAATSSVAPQPSSWNTPLFRRRHASMTMGDGTSINNI